MTLRIISSAATSSVTSPSATTATTSSAALGFPSPQPIPQASSSSTLAYIERKRYEKYMDLFLIPDKNLWHESSLLQPIELVTLLFNEIHADKSVLLRSKEAMYANPQIYIEQFSKVLQEYQDRIIANPPLRVSHKEILYLWQLHTHFRYSVSKESAEPVEEQVKNLVILMISKLSLEQKGQLIRFACLSDYHRGSCDELRAIIKKELYYDINSTLECKHKPQYSEWLSTQQILELCIQFLDNEQSFKNEPELAPIVKARNFTAQYLALRNKCEGWLNQLKAGEEVHLPKYFINLNPYFSNNPSTNFDAAFKSGRIYPLSNSAFSGVLVENCLNAHHSSNTLALPFFLEWRKNSHILNIISFPPQSDLKHNIHIGFKDQIPICAFDSHQKPINKYLLLFSDKSQKSKTLQLNEPIPILSYEQSQLLVYLLQKFALLIPNHLPDFKLTFSESYKGERSKLSALYQSILPHKQTSSHVCRDMTITPSSSPAKAQTSIAPSQTKNVPRLTASMISSLLGKTLSYENSLLVYESLLLALSQRELTHQEIDFLRAKVQMNPSLAFAKQIVEACRKTKHSYNTFLSHFKFSETNSVDIQQDNQKFVRLLQEHLKTIKASTESHASQSSAISSTSSSTAATKRHGSSLEKKSHEKKSRTSPVPPVAPPASPPPISANQTPVAPQSPPSTSTAAASAPLSIIGTPSSLVNDYCSGKEYLDLLYGEHPELNPWHPEGEGIQLELSQPLPEFSSERFFAFCADAPHIAQEAIKHGYLKGVSDFYFLRIAASNESLMTLKNNRASQLAQIQEIFGLETIPPPLRHTWSHFNCLDSENDRLFGDQIGTQPFLIYNFKSVQTLLYKYALTTRVFLKYDSDPRSAAFANALKNAKEPELKDDLNIRFLSIMTYFMLDQAEEPKEEELLYSDFLRCKVPGSNYIVKVDPDTFDRCNFKLNQRIMPNEPLLLHRILKKLNKDELTVLPYHLQKETTTTNKRLMIATRLILEMAKAIHMRYFNNQNAINSYFQETLKITPILSNEPLLKVLEGATEAEIQKLPSYASSIIKLPAK